MFFFFIPVYTIYERSTIFRLLCGVVLVPPTHHNLSSGDAAVFVIGCPGNTRTAHDTRRKVYSVVCKSPEFWAARNRKAAPHKVEVYYRELYKKHIEVYFHELYKKQGAPQRRPQRAVP